MSVFTTRTSTGPGASPMCGKMGAHLGAQLRQEPEGQGAVTPLTWPSRGDLMSAYRVAPVGAGYWPVRTRATPTPLLGPSVSSGDT